MSLVWLTDKAYIAHLRQEYEQHKRFAHAIRSHIDPNNTEAPITEAYQYHAQKALELAQKLQKAV